MIGRRVYDQSRCACGLGLCVVRHIGVSVFRVGTLVVLACALSDT